MVNIGFIILLSLGIVGAAVVVGIGITGLIILIKLLVGR